MGQADAAMAADERGPASAPAVLSFPADLVTPVRAFLALTEPGQDAYLLESVAGGESQARYSFLGFGLREVFEAGRSARILKDGMVRELPGQPLAALADWTGRFPRPAAGPPVPFLGGAVGWMDFSAFALSEPVLDTSMAGARDPRIRLGFFAEGMVLDHLRQEGFLYRVPAAGEAGGDCLARLACLRNRLEQAVPSRPATDSWTLERSPDRERFSRNFAAVQEAIRDGDAYQVVLSEPFSGHFEGDPFSVYRRLRCLNPSPYHFYVSLGGRQAVGASPEMLVRAEERRVSTVPIAGTRPRGRTSAEDMSLEEDLLKDPKELAEHAMLVDLARNDLGRVCEHGSVSVPVRCNVERFSHVMHIVSEVQGDLAAGRSALEALASTFPAGTVSGAPKIRAVQILTGLEGEDRGLYGGAVGVIGPGGDLEFCIAIRTLEFEAGRAGFRCGAGVVADSREESEWAEIHHKAGALLAALAGSTELASFPHPLIPSSPHHELRRAAAEGENP